MENKEKRLIEIQGIKMEIDTRHATKIESFRVGDTVKLLVKEYSGKYKVYPGVIVGFENFKKLPTIIVIYLDDYTAQLKFAYINEASTETPEIVHSEPDDIPIEKDYVLQQIDKDILKKEEAIRELKIKKQYFLNQFHKFLTGFQAEEK